MNVREGKIPEGKGMFAYVLSNSWIGSMASLADYLKFNGYTWFAPKMQDGASVFDTNNQQALLDELVPELHRVGVDMVGWGYVYGETNWYRKLYNWCDKEIAVTIQMIAKYKPVAWIVDAEAEYKLAGANESAVKYMNGIKSAMALTNDAVPDIPLGFSSYRFPVYHPEVPWLEFLSRSDFAAPQVYWWGDMTPTGSVTQLNRSVEQYNARGALNMPFVPAGTFRDDAGTWWATPDQITNFNQACYDSDQIIGMNYWDLRFLQQRQTLEDALNGFVWTVEEPTEPPISDFEAATIYLLSVIREDVRDIKTFLMGEQPEPTPEPPPEPTPEPPVIEYTEKTVYRDGKNVYLSYYTEMNDGNPDAIPPAPPRPMFKFYPKDTALVADRVCVPSGSVLRVTESVKGDGGNVGWKLIDPIPLAPGSAPIPDGVQLYIMQKFIV